jgi:hypothetical protein
MSHRKLCVLVIAWAFFLIVVLLVWTAVRFVRWIF